MSTKGAQFKPTEAPNLNALWSRLAVEEWSRLGVSLAVVCPGSRSAPLANAIAENPAIRSTIAHDERAAGFVALGAARATGRAAVVVTTSGTAAANLLPAVVEASATGTPLIVVTADRPPELRDCGANQSISQCRIFGEFARWAIDVPCADAGIAPSWILSTVDEAWTRAHAPSWTAGPVHFNWMFREPLTPREVTWDRALVGDLRQWGSSRNRWRAEAPRALPIRTWDVVVDELVAAIDAARGSASKVVLCVGALYSPQTRSIARGLAHALGCPTIADIGSGLRHGDVAGLVIGHADLVALSPELQTRLCPEFIVRFGGGISSRRVSEFLTRAREQGARELVVRDGPERMDPQHGASFELAVDVSTRAAEPSQTRMSTSAIREFIDESYSVAWLRADACAANVLAAQLDEGSSRVDEPSTARIVAANCPSGTTLLVGNSMPIRDADMHAARGVNAPMITVNRGASGIDGLIATAVGHARATGEPTIALVGDLSLLHDLNSLALVAASPVGTVIVVVNNDGGGIFHFLPLCDHPKLLEPWTTAPHGFDFSSAAKMFGLHYEAPAVRGELQANIRAAIGRASESGKSTVIEVQTNRVENVQFHRTIQTAVLAALDQECAALANSVSEHAPR